MIDTHTHIDMAQFDEDRELALERAFSGDVKKIINVGADRLGSQRSCLLAQKDVRIFATVGLHPHIFNAENIDRMQMEQDLKKISELAEDKKVVAVGEIGLDYFSHTKTMITEQQKKQQKEGFIRQIEMAAEKSLPVVVHCRDAYEDVLEIILKFTQVQFVFHCYMGSLDFTEQLLKMNNIRFSFTGNITYAKENSETMKVIELIPLEKIMIETDCPYLTPAPYRGKRNEPAFVR
jgi:TatD DNase family protein